jgi:two-component system cell cycle response regulator
MKMPVRILIIEDHIDNLELMNYLLKAYGYEVLVAGDGVSGMTIAEQEGPELILCDIQIPGIDGYEVAKRLKRDAGLRTIPLIAITALAMVGDRERILLSGFDGYIAKPITPERFVGEVEMFLKPEQRLTIIRPPRPIVSDPISQMQPAQTTLVPVAPRATILVVDNTTANLELACSIFEPSGYRVLAARNVDEALNIARRIRPDLVLSDINMPETTGFQLLSIIKTDENLKGIPVVLISATVPRELDRVQVMARGASQFLRRPIDASTLLEEVEACLRDSALAAAKKPLPAD